MDSGSLTTKPFKLEGDRLLTNVETRGGELRIEVLNEDGDTLPGYDAASFVPITTDALRAEAQWRGESLKGLAGKRIRLGFHLTRAKLFSFQVN